MALQLLMFYSYKQLFLASVLPQLRHICAPTLKRAQATLPSHALFPQVQALK